MLTIYDKTGSGLAKHEEGTPISEQTVWFDLFEPTREEDEYVEKLLGISVPTRDEMREIEASSRFYQDRGAYYSTAYILNDVGQEIPDGTAITSIIAGNRLVTVRYTDPKGIPQYMQRLTRGETDCNSGQSILVGLLETHVERLADLIERVQDEVDTLASGIFNGGARRDKSRRLDVILNGIGKEGDIVARAQESATSLDRVLHFLKHMGRSGACDGTVLERIDVAQRDVVSLMDHLKFLSGRTQFLLDATLGMISTEQNQIIKLFSVMAVTLMPPTLIASIYGMNFKFMPELDWPHGYYAALGLMLVSALVPFLYFKRKGWL